MERTQVMSTDSMKKTYQIKEEGGFKYYEAGEGQTLLLLHGLFGALSNFTDLIDHFSDRYNVVVPLLPLFELPKDDTSVTGLLNYVSDLVRYKGYKDMVLIGNSLGGHIALLYTMEHKDMVKAIVLTGSSGLFEDSLGKTYPRKSDYEYIKEKTAKTFYNPEMATKELVDEVFDIVNTREKALAILYLAKSALRHNLRENVREIKVPVLLVWGAADIITPPFVGEEFHRLLPDSELHILEQSGHAPMMEQPTEFNDILNNFLQNKGLV